MNFIKPLALSLTLIAGTSAFAGNPLPADPDPIPMPPMEEPGSSSNGLIVPLLILTLIGLAS